MGFDFEKLDVYREAVALACVPLFELALREDWIDRDLYNQFYERLNGLAKALSGLINSLARPLVNRGPIRP